MKNKLEDDKHCFVCGEKNPNGLNLTFSIREGKAFAEFILHKTYQGYKDIVHGGIISTLLDEVMVKVAIMQEMPAVTAEITVRFKNPLMVGEKAIVEAHIIETNRRIINTSATIKKLDGTLIAEGYAKLLRQD
ncbi:MAG: PaaI family thioesterase [Nitrospirota bacterium]|nr:PaaI family thioesterase [Nitrospirota bacterium]